VFILTGRVGLDVVVAVIIVGTDFNVEEEIVVGIVFVVIVDVEGTVVVVVAACVVDKVEVVVIGFVVVDVEVLVEAVVDVVTTKITTGIKGDPAIGIPTLLVVLDEVTPGFVVLVVIVGAAVVLDASL